MGSPYAHRSWAAAVRHWRTQQRRRRLVCARCGDPIAAGRQRGPAALDVGHIIGVSVARELGWTIGEMNAVSNTQPEHQRCNREAGARAGNAARALGRPVEPVTTRAW